MSRIRLDTGLFIKSKDPLFPENGSLQVKFYLTSTLMGKEYPLGETHVMPCSQEQQEYIFTQHVEATFQFSEDQTMRFDILHVQQGHSTVVTSVSAALGKIVSSPNMTQLLPLFVDSKCVGYLKISAKEIDHGQKEEITLQFSCVGLEKKSIFGGKPDTFYTLSIPPATRFSVAHPQEEEEVFEEDTRIDAVSEKIVYTSEIVQKSLTPIWNAFKISMQELCQGDKERDVTIAVYFAQKGSTQDAGKSKWKCLMIELVGRVNIKCASLCMFQGQEYDLIDYNPRKTLRRPSIVKQNHPKQSPILRLESFSTETKYSFLDFVASGLTLNFAVAVDFTRSNGDPWDPESLHYRQPNVMNQYQQVICAIANVLEHYDEDKLFPVYGFGARLQADAAVTSHCFPLNGNDQDSNCCGVQGIFDAYSNALSVVKLSGPTNFSPVIKRVSQTVKEEVNEKGDGYFYSILLILTDGDVTDMDATIDAIIEASTLPLSIVIVGIGNEDFSKMVHLDSDGTLLTSADGQRKAARDIVQFVPYKRHVYDQNSAKLAKDVLEEIPDHIVEYMKLREYKPVVRQGPTVQVDWTECTPLTDAITSSSDHEQHLSKAEMEIMQSILGQDGSHSYLDPSQSKDVLPLSHTSIHHPSASKMHSPLPSTPQIHRFIHQPAPVQGETIRTSQESGIRDSQLNPNYTRISGPYDRRRSASSIHERSSLEQSLHHASLHDLAAATTPQIVLKADSIPFPKRSHSKLVDH